MEVVGFDSFEEMQAIMAAATHRANAGLNDRQRDLRDDLENTRYWVSPDRDNGVLVFGVCWSINDYRDQVALMLPDGPIDLDSEDLIEVLWELDGYAVNRMAGYLRGKFFSVLDPRGDPHDYHVSQVMPISRSAFLEAEHSGWRAVDVPPMDLILMGEHAARQGGWTPILIEEMHEIQTYINSLED